MICPNCQLTDIDKHEKICPRCGLDLPATQTLSDAERDAIIEKSLLKGKVAQLETREKGYLKLINQLKSYIVLLLFLLPISHCIFKKEPIKPSFTDITSHTLYEMTKQQLDYALQELATDRSDSVYLYVMQRGDFPINLSMRFYNTAAYADTILIDNTIRNDKRIIAGDTLIIRINPDKYIPNIQTLKKERLRKQK